MPEKFLFVSSLLIFSIYFSKTRENPVALNIKINSRSLLRRL